MLQSLLFSFETAEGHFLDSEQQPQQQFLDFGGAKSYLKKKLVQVKPTGSDWKKVQILSKCPHSSL